MRRRDTRAAIIDAAVAILGREGPEGFSASALAREVGVSKATLFHHFASLDEIPLAAFDRLIGQILDLAPPGDAPLGETLARFGEGTFAVVEERREVLGAYLVFLGKAMFDQRLRERFRLSGESLLARMCAMFAPHTKSQEEAAALARLTAIVLDGMALHALALGDRAGIERAWALFCETVSRERISR